MGNPVRSYYLLLLLSSQSSKSDLLIQYNLSTTKKANSLEKPMNGNFIRPVILRTYKYFKKRERFI